MATGLKEIERVDIDLSFDKVKDLWAQILNKMKLQNSDLNISFKWRVEGPGPVDGAFDVGEHIFKDQIGKPVALAKADSLWLLVPSWNTEPKKTLHFTHGGALLIPVDTLIVRWEMAGRDRSCLIFSTSFDSTYVHAGTINFIENELDALDLVATEGNGAKRGPKFLGCNVWLDYMIHVKGYEPGHDPDADKLYHMWLKLYDFERGADGDWDNYTKAIRDAKDRRSKDT